MSNYLEKLHLPIYMDEFISSLRSFLHQGCSCLSFPSITAAFAEIAIKISAPRFALFFRWGIWMKGRFFKEMALFLADRLTWLPAFSGLFRFIFGRSFWNVSFACPTYCIPQSELEAFFSLIQILLSVCSLLALPLSLFPSGYSAICSCLWHLLSSLFHYSFRLSLHFTLLLPILYLSICFPPCLNHPIDRLCGSVLWHLWFFWHSSTTIIFSVYLGRNSSPLYTYILWFKTYWVNIVVIPTLEQVVIHRLQSW